jgi:hypothetical protein
VNGGGWGGEGIEVRLGEGVGGCVWGCGAGQSIPAGLGVSTSESKRVVSVKSEFEADEEENGVEEGDLDSL